MGERRGVLDEPTGSKEHRYLNFSTKMDPKRFFGCRKIGVHFEHMIDDVRSSVTSAQQKTTFVYPSVCFRVKRTLFCLS